MTLSRIPPNPRTALVLGAGGTIGGEVATALLADGWRVRALARRPGSDRRLAGKIEWVGGDAMRAEDVIAAATGTSLIFHGVNPPGYRNWRGLALPMMRNSIEAARHSGARLVLPGTIYNYGSDSWPLITESSPQHPATRKGRVRAEMEAMMRDATASGVRSLIVRAGDFFGPDAQNSWLTKGLLSAKPLTVIRYPGPWHVGHAWAYVPDLAQTIVRLADIEAQLPAFETYNFGGHWFDRGVDIAEIARRALGKPDLPIRSFPWAAVYLAAPFVTMLREMIEMRYLWQVPIRLDNAKLVARLGAEPHTPIDVAMAHTLRGHGHLPAAAERPEGGMPLSLVG